MNIITKELLEQKMQRLEKDTNKVYNNLKALHKRERKLALQRLTNQWSDAYLDLYQLSKYNVDYLTDPTWSRLVSIREIFSKIRIKTY